MAIYDNLPVYKQAYDMLLQVSSLTPNFSKAYKYSLGNTLHQQIMKMIISIFRANIHKEKQSYIQEAREHTETIRLLVRLSKDLHQLPLKQFVMINQCIESVSKQLTGWGKSIK